MMKLLSGSAHPALADDIATLLDHPLTPVDRTTFKDGERYVRIQESVRGHDVFIIQSTCCPVNDTLMELLLLIDAAKRASAASISVAIPYYGYARQDRKANGREPISAKLVANMLETAGADRILTIDIHSRQQQGFFNIPLDDLWAAPIFHDYIDADDPVVVAPDAGGVQRARHLAKLLDAPIAVIDKRRYGHNQSDAFHVLGDVAGNDAIILDDMIDTGGTITDAARAVNDKGAASVTLCATHGVLSDDATQRLEASHADEVILTNTIPITSAGKRTVLNVAPILAAAIRNIYNRDSVSSLAEASFTIDVVTNGTTSTTTS
jgi:ribose-phosphate pyrophosphokinase